MTRMSKQGERRHKSPKARRFPSPKTGPLKDNLPQGFKPQENALQEKGNQTIFIPKIQ